MAAMTLAALLWQASPALACGIVVSRNGLVEADAFAAMIAYDGVREDVAVRLAYEKVTEDFGWVMPVPALPTLAAADLSGFATAARITTPPEPPRGAGFGSGGVGAGPPGGVDVLSRSIIGDLEFVVLRASGTGALSEWMMANAFAFHYGQAEALGRYLDRGWLVIAARLAQQVAAARNAASVRVSFATPTLVYPLAAAKATHPGSLRTTFFTITPWRPAAQGLPEGVVRPLADRSFPAPAARLDLRYTAPLASSDAASLSRTVPVPAGAWLTRYDSTWDLLTIDRDLTLARSTDQSVVDFSGLQVEEGPPVAAIAGLVVLVLAGTGLLAWRARWTRWLAWSAAAGLAAVGAVAIALSSGVEEGAPVAFVVGWAALAGACFVAWRTARGRVLGRVFLVLGILATLFPVAATILFIVLIALNGGCFYGYYDAGQCR